MPATLDFSLDQEAALTRIDAWRFGRTSPYLTLGGYAGTGKSTLVAYLAECWPGAAVAALCGKAAHVLRQKGTPASTIHSLIYELVTKDGPPRFRKKDHLPFVSAVLIDEASMIDHVLKADLLSFGLPVLFVGDHGQLEPVGTDPGLMKRPDIKLERIHRQAEGNPILRLATAFREGRDVPYTWNAPDFRLRIRPRSEATEWVKPGRQIICGYNRTRHKVNAEMRAMLGYEGLVCPGELLVCLRNNRQYGVFNGQQLTVLDVEPRRGRLITVSVQADDGRAFYVPLAADQFGADMLRHHRDPKVVLCDYGYALTCHKSQGSSWPEVLVYEEIASKWDPKRWRYTAATRAEERLIYCA